MLFRVIALLVTLLVVSAAQAQETSMVPVMGVDFNAAMIETARTQTPPAGAPVAWREGDAHALPCADATFDVVCCQQGLQFFPDKPHALREMHRVLGPGGRLVWAPGKVYTVYLSKKQGTGIFLPPGERLVSGLYLDPEAYEVQTKRAGVGDGAYDALTIRPTGDSGEVGAFLLTESGRRYLLHLVVGSVGMLAVTFEGPLVTHAPMLAPALVLPQPPQ